MTLPDKFTVRGGGWMRTYVATAWRGNERWMIESTIKYPLIGATTVTARPADEEHVRKLYEEYPVIEETDF